MRRLIALLTLPLLTHIATAATFVVDSLADFDDDDPGDGLCETVRGSPPFNFTLDCSLRGAIQEANAQAGSDVIEFSVAGRITLSAALGALPPAGELLIIDGSSAPGAPGRDGASPAAPVIVIDAINLSSPTDGLWGLEFGAGSSGSQALNLAVINVPGDGIAVRDDLVWISGCWLGVEPLTGVAADNNDGLRINADQVFVGRQGGGLGRGNVISGNRANGILGLPTNNSLFRGNRIGVNAAGTAVIANGNAAMSVTGDGNQIGAAIGSDSERNVIAGSPFTNLSVNGLNNVIRGNFIGCGIGATLVNGGDGVKIVGDDAIVGGVAAGEGNFACDHAGIGIEINGAVVGVTTDDATVSGNNLSNNGTGIRVRSADGAGVSDNLITGSVDDGVLLESGETATVDGNTIQGSGAHGIRVFAASNNAVTDNDISLSQSRGIWLTSNADDNRVQFNRIGGMGQPGGIQGGVLISGSDNNEVSGNVIAENGGSAVSVVSSGAGTPEGNKIIDNRMFDNAGLGIDLGDDGPTANDSGDVDLGPNLLQNSPVLQLLDFTPVPAEATVRVTVDTSDGNVPDPYPIAVHFYLADPSTLDQGDGFLVVEFIDTPGAKDFSVGTGGMTGGHLIATATDAAGNTSEFSAPLIFGNPALPEDVFSDSFEEL